MNIIWCSVTTKSISSTSFAAALRSGKTVTPNSDDISGYSNDGVAAELERLATATSKWNELLTEYTQVAQGMTDATQAANMWVNIARWYDSALDHRIRYRLGQEGAVAGSQPRRCHVRTGGFLSQAWPVERLVAILSKHVDLEPDTERKVEVLLSLAETFEVQSSDAGQATACYEQALRCDERCLPAIDALERLHRRSSLGTAWPRSLARSRKSSTTSNWPSSCACRLASCGSRGLETTSAPSRPTARSSPSIRRICRRSSPWSSSTSRPAVPMPT